MYLQHFGLTHAPLGKELTEPWDDGALSALKQRFDWLLQSPGVGLLTGEPGVGKTAALRCLTSSLNPHRYQVLYQAETDFGRVDIYRALAHALGVEPSYRRAQLWRGIKQRVYELVHAKQVTPLWIIDEAQNLPLEFFRDFPAFLQLSLRLARPHQRVAGWPSGADADPRSRALRRAAQPHPGPRRAQTRDRA